MSENVYAKKTISSDSISLLPMWLLNLDIYVCERSEQEKKIRLFKIEKKRTKKKTVAAAKTILKNFDLAIFFGPPPPLNPPVEPSSADGGSFEGSMASR